MTRRFPRIYRRLRRAGASHGEAADLLIPAALDRPGALAALRTYLRGTPPRSNLSAKFQGALTWQS